MLELSYALLMTFQTGIEIYACPFFISYYPYFPINSRCALSQ